MARQRKCLILEAKMEEFEKEYDLQEASQFLCVQVRTLREWVKNGKIKAKKYSGSGKWIVSREEIERIRKGE